MLKLAVLVATGFVCGFIVSRTNPVQTFSRRDLPSGIQGEFDEIEAKWRRHEVKTTVLLTCLELPLRVEIVDDGREAAYGFAETPWLVDDLYASSHQQFDVYAVERGSPLVLFVVIQKPYLFGLETEKEVPEG
ncbi:MAG: hypothetical protein JNG89_02425 [Planctomycetaceae bacterium]|nr:hypothetical protein [Planctomycetaceae bacterium]